MNCIVIYDSKCGICAYLANSFKNKNSHPSGNLQFIPNDSMEALHLAKEYSIADITESIFFIDNETEKLYKHSSAVLEIIKYYKTYWRIIGVLLSLPIFKQISDYLYYYISKKRSRISRLFGLAECSIRNNST